MANKPKETIEGIGQAMSDTASHAVGTAIANGNDAVEKAVDAASQAAEGATQTAQSFKESASKLARQAGDKARDLMADGTTRAAGALGEVGRMVNDAATTVDEKIGEQYGKYARGAGQAISNFSETLKEKKVDDLIDDARGFVRKSPAVAIGIAAAVGFVVARLVRAGSDSSDANDKNDA